MKKHYPIRNWIRLLDNKTQAALLANMQAQHGDRATRMLDRAATTLHSAIDNAILWARTPEGHGFWSREYDKAYRNKRTPEDRPDIDCTIPEETS